MADWINTSAFAWLVCRRRWATKKAPGAGASRSMETSRGTKSLDGVEPISKLVKVPESRTELMTIRSGKGCSSFRVRASEPRRSYRMGSAGFCVSYRCCPLPPLPATPPAGYAAPARTPSRLPPPDLMGINRAGNESAHLIDWLKMKNSNAPAAKPPS
jgi:hypothetical protein